VNQFTLVNKLRNRIKVFKPFKSSLKEAQEMIEIEYGCVYKSSSKPVMKGSRVELIEKAREEYKQMLEEGWKKTSIYNLSTYKQNFES